MGKSLGSPPGSQPESSLLLCCHRDTKRHSSTWHIWWLFVYAHLICFSEPNQINESFCWQPGLLHFLPLIASTGHNYLTSVRLSLQWVYYFLFWYPLLVSPFKKLLKEFFLLFPNRGSFGQIIYMYLGYIYILLYSL